MPTLRDGDADQKFFETHRKISPRFPSVVDALERRRRRTEDLSGRMLFVLAIIFLIGAPFGAHPTFMLVGAGAFLFGFVVHCFVAGNRTGKYPRSKNNAGPFGDL